MLEKPFIAHLKCGFSPS